MKKLRRLLLLGLAFCLATPVMAIEKDIRADHYSGDVYEALCLQGLEQAELYGVMSVEGSDPAEPDSVIQAEYAVVGNGIEGERPARCGETALGDLVTDAMLWYGETYMGGADGAIINGGGIRADLPVGTIERQHMEDVLPFGNTETLVEVTGAQLLEALESACQVSPQAAPGFPQVAGIELVLIPDVPYEQGPPYSDNPQYYSPAAPGARVEILSIGGEPYSATKTYCIITNDFLAEGGDGYVSLTEGKQTTTTIELVNVVMEYCAEVHGGVMPDDYRGTQGRIRQVSPALTIPEDMARIAEEQTGTVWVAGYDCAGRFRGVRAVTGSEIPRAELPWGCAVFRAFCLKEEALSPLTDPVEIGC